MELSQTLRRVRKGLAHRSPVRFVQAVQRRRAQSWQPGDQWAAGLAGELQRDGVVRLNALLSPAEVAEIRARVDPLLEAALAGEPIPNRVLKNNDGGSVIVEDVGDDCDAIARALSAHGIADLVADAARGSVVPTLVRAELKRPGANDEYPVQNSNVDVWHCDHWDLRTKAMVYLDDVGAGNAPLQYVGGSHTHVGWSNRWLAAHWVREFLMAVPRVPQMLTWFWSRSARRSAATVRTLTGPAGTVVVFDTRGLHQGTPLQQHERRILNISFSLEDS